MTPADAEKRFAVAIRARQDLQPISATVKLGVMRRVLTALAERGLDMASVTARDMALYREFLRSMVGTHRISESYAGFTVKQWNATIRTLFGPEGEPLVLRGFKQSPKVVATINEAEMGALRQAILDAPTGGQRHEGFMNEHYRRAFYAYAELAFATGCRYGSAVNVRAGDIDFARGCVRFRHMKNEAKAKDHVAALTPRATRVLKEWVEHLMARPFWVGVETPVLVGPEGEPLTLHFVNHNLKRMAIAAGIRKPLSSHKVRKATGTIIGSRDPKYAAQQLGITDKVYAAHYNMKTLEDRLAHRDLLPGFEPHETFPKPPEERLLPRPGIPSESGYG